MRIWHAWALLWALGVLLIAAAVGLTVTAGYVLYRIAEILTVPGG